MISSEEVKNLANLARIEISEKEAENLQKDLGEILDYVSQLQKAPADKPEILSARGGSALGGNVFREDESVKDESGAKKGEYVRVKHIL